MMVSVVSGTRSVSDFSKSSMLFPLVPWTAAFKPINPDETCAISSTSPHPPPPPHADFVLEVVVACMLPCSNDQKGAEQISKKDGKPLGWALHVPQHKAEGERQQRPGPESPRESDSNRQRATKQASGHKTNHAKHAAKQQV